MTGSVDTALYKLYRQYSASSRVVTILTRPALSGLLEEIYTIYSIKIIQLPAKDESIVSDIYFCPFLVNTSAHRHLLAL